jgi:CubicO group peptidase (beta-lactamase class C family)
MSRFKTIGDYMTFLKDAAVEFTPGNRQSYSNTGYIFLGAVIEKITGQSYADYIQQHIFNVAGMKNSGLNTRDKNIATGYTKGFGETVKHDLMPNSDMQPIIGTSAGGGYSNAEDMLLFFKNLYDFKFLNKEMTSFFTNNYNTSDGQLKSWTAGGGSSGLEAFAKYDFKNNLLIVALSNFDPPSAQTVVRKAENRLYK